VSTSAVAIPPGRSCYPANHRTFSRIEITSGPCSRDHHHLASDVSHARTRCRSTRSRAIECIQHASAAAVGSVQRAIMVEAGDGDAVGDSPVTTTLPSACTRMWSALPHSPNQNDAVPLWFAPKVTSGRHRS